MTKMCVPKIQQLEDKPIKKIYIILTCLIWESESTVLRVKFILGGEGSLSILKDSPSEILLFVWLVFASQYGRNRKYRIKYLLIMSGFYLLCFLRKLCGMTILFWNVCMTGCRTKLHIHSTAQIYNHSATNKKQTNKQTQPNHKNSLRLCVFICKQNCTSTTLWS